MWQKYQHTYGKDFGVKQHILHKIWTISLCQEEETPLHITYLLKLNQKVFGTTMHLEKWALLPIITITRQDPNWLTMGDPVFTLENPLTMLLKFMDF
jgi:hypothetical protein